MMMWSPSPLPPFVGIMSLLVLCWSQSEALRNGDFLRRLEGHTQAPVEEFFLFRNLNAQILAGPVSATEMGVAPGAVSANDLYQYFNPAERGSAGSGCPAPAAVFSLVDGTSVLERCDAAGNGHVTGRRVAGGPSPSGAKEISVLFRPHDLPAEEVHDPGPGIGAPGGGMGPAHFYGHGGDGAPPAWTEARFPEEREPPSAPDPIAEYASSGRGGGGPGGPPPKGPPGGGRIGVPVETAFPKSFPELFAGDDEFFGTSGSSLTMTNAPDYYYSSTGTSGEEGGAEEAGDETAQSTGGLVAWEKRTARRRLRPKRRGGGRKLAYFVVPVVPLPASVRKTVFEIISTEEGREGGEQGRDEEEEVSTAAESNVEDEDEDESSSGGEDEDARN